MSLPGVRRLWTIAHMTQRSGQAGQQEPSEIEDPSRNHLRLTRVQLVPLPTASTRREYPGGGDLFLKYLTLHMGISTFSENWSQQMWSQGWLARLSQGDVAGIFLERSLEKDGCFQKGDKKKWHFSIVCDELNSFLLQNLWRENCKNTNYR